MKINVNNREKLNRELDAVQRRAQVRTLTAAEILRVSQQAEQRLSDVGLSAQLKRGAQLRFGMCGPFPSAYKYPASGTVGTLERFASGWFVVDLHRGDCDGHNYFRLTPEQQQRISERAVDLAADYDSFCK